MFFLRCLVRSGNPEHPGDILQNATFQIRSSANGLNGNYNITNDGYIDFGTIVDGFVNVFIPEELNPIEEARIKYYDNSSHWVILSEVCNRVERTWLLSILRRLHFADLHEVSQLSGCLNYHNRPAK